MTDSDLEALHDENLESESEFENDEANTSESSEYSYDSFDQLCDTASFCQVERVGRFYFLHFFLKRSFGQAKERVNKRTAFEKLVVAFEKKPAATKF